MATAVALPAACPEQSEKSLAEHRCDRGVKRASKAGKSAKDVVATTDVVATHGLAKAA